MADNARLLTPGVSPAQASRGEHQGLTILTTSGLTLDLWRIGNVYASPDSRDADHEHFAPLFEASGGLGLHSEPEECLVSGDQVVIIDRVRIAPAWRGPGGVGRLPIGRMLRRVAGRAAIVATHPYPIDIPVGERDDATREAREKAVVQRAWQSWGSRPSARRCQGRVPKQPWPTSSVACVTGSTPWKRSLRRTKARPGGRLHQAPAGPLADPERQRAFKHRESQRPSSHRR
ncbi:hypothetical protein [Streptomyces sp. NPDC018711]|uniref:hypothetical protein n=1 Tax=Streptomyces sp. NPDC018711 TaxID=3365052 RepID=UPI00378AD4F5